MQAHVVGPPPASDPIVVFQCKNCRSILSDSTFLLEMDEKAQILTFSGSGNYEFSSQLLTSSDDYDRGCSFSLLVCKECKKTVGRWYTSTPRQLDKLRDKFCYFLSSLITYEIGGKNVSLAPNSEGAKDTISGLNKSIVRMMQMMCLYHERLERLENTVLDASRNNQM